MTPTRPPLCKPRELPLAPSTVSAAKVLVMATNTTWPKPPPRVPECTLRACLCHRAVNCVFRGTHEVVDMTTLLSCECLPLLQLGRTLAPSTRSHAPRPSSHPSTRGGDVIGVAPVPLLLRVLSLGKHERRHLCFLCLFADETCVWTIPASLAPLGHWGTLSACLDSTLCTAKLGALLAPIVWPGR